MKKILILLSCFAISFSHAQVQDTLSHSYQDEIEQWHQKRVKSLKSEAGWLNIVGLFWLKEGENTFGSSKKNDIVFPEGKANETLGTFILKDSVVSLKVNRGVSIESDSHEFAGGIIFSGGLEKSLVLAHRTLRWFIIKRGDKYGVRLRDLESAASKNFTDIERFPVDKKWRIIAKYEAPVTPKTIPINDVIGLTTETPFGGTLFFEVEGKKIQLDATLEGEDLFIVFADKTTGNETYGGGRFLYAKRPVSGDIVVLDFNKAYNPPCCFTDYATCPLPPVQNRLSIKVTAGEKTYGHH